jgi:hypothetical protein
VKLGASLARRTSEYDSSSTSAAKLSACAPAVSRASPASSGTATASSDSGIGSGASQARRCNSTRAGSPSRSKLVCQVIATLFGYCIRRASYQASTFSRWLCHSSRYCAKLSRRCAM